ncbi:MAG TPA: glycoside hydrolase domain-containing protein, partial [Flavisolibacter sp.]
IDGATIQVDKERSLHIAVKNNSAKNKYIQEIQLNGRKYTRSYITYADMMSGGELIITMGQVPSKTWGVAPADRPN